MLHPVEFHIIKKMNTSSFISFLLLKSLKHSMYIILCTMNAGFTLFIRFLTLNFILKRKEKLNGGSIYDG